MRVHPENLDRQKLPSAAKQGRRLEAALPRDQRLGALPDRQRLPDREAVPQPLEGGAAHAASCGASTCPSTTGSSRPPTSREREHWDDYQEAFSEMLSHTSTEWAPWYVIPADRKWFARIAAGAVLVARADGDRSAVPDRRPRSSARRCSRSRRRSRRRRRRAPRLTRSSRERWPPRRPTARRAPADARSVVRRPAPEDGDRAARRRSRRSGSRAARRPSCSTRTARTRCRSRSRCRAGGGSSASTGATCR